MNELFDIKELRKSLTQSERKTAAKRIINAANLGKQYCYTLREAAGILHWSYDQFNIDRDEIKKLNGYSVTGDSIKLAFPSEYMGKKVRFDKNNDDVIIIESKKLAERLKDELL